MTNEAAIGYLTIAAKYYGLSIEKVSELKILMEIFMELCTEEQAEAVRDRFLYTKF